MTDTKDIRWQPRLPRSLQQKKNGHSIIRVGRQARFAGPWDVFFEDPTFGECALPMCETDVRMGKVAALRGAIAAGTYWVSAQDVAGKMIEGLLTGI